MSSDIAIKIENLSKCYQIYNTPGDRLKQFIIPKFKHFFSQSVDNLSLTTYFNEVWALKDITLTIKKGEAVGIVGRNGSGKSTILQIICGTLHPSTGLVTTKGRIAALLELGSGFNPEFTGRENVYVNALLLGLTQAEIDARYDKIVKFADIGDFIEQPVKTYSSGMTLRLAFAVLAHVDADILIIDEALAVGDAVFQQKCMRFIRNFIREGTLLFVSHDAASVMNLCQTAVWLHDGKIMQSGISKDVTKAYLQYTLQEIYGDEAELKSTEKIDTESPTPEKEDAKINTPVNYTSKLDINNNLDEAKGWKTGAGEILSISLEHISPNQDNVFQGGENVRIRIQAIAHQDLDQPILGFIFRDRLGQDLFGENTLPYTDSNPYSVDAGTTFEGEFQFQLPMLPNGEYAVMASLANGTIDSNTQHHWLHDALIVNVTSNKIRWGLVGINFENVILRDKS